MRLEFTLGAASFEEDLLGLATEPTSRERLRIPACVGALARIEHHGGYIEYHSLQGGRGRLDLQLPLAPGCQAGIAEVAANEVGELGGLS